MLNRERKVKESDTTMFNIVDVAGNIKIKILKIKQWQIILTLYH
jgi:hypothetical protein